MAETRSRDAKTRSAERAEEVLSFREKDRRGKQRDLRSSLFDHDDAAMDLLEVVLGDILREQLRAARNWLAELGKNEAVRRLGIAYPSLNDLERGYESRKVAGSEMCAVSVKTLAQMAAVYGLGLRVEFVTVGEMEEFVEGWDVEKWGKELVERGGSTRRKVEEEGDKEMEEERVAEEKTEGKTDSKGMGKRLSKADIDMKKYKKRGKRYQWDPGITKEEIEEWEKRKKLGLVEEEEE